MRLLVLCTYHEVASNLPQGCVPQNFAMLFAYLLLLPYLVLLHPPLSLNRGIVTLILCLSGRERPDFPVMLKDFEQKTTFLWFISFL